MVQNPRKVIDGILAQIRSALFGFDKKIKRGEVSGSGSGPGSEIQVRRAVFSAVVSPGEIRKARRKWKDVRDDADIEAALIRRARRRAVIAVAEHIRDHATDYCHFDEYRDDKGHIFVRATVKILKGDD